MLPSCVRVKRALATNPLSNRLRLLTSSPLRNSLDLSLTLSSRMTCPWVDRASAPRSASILAIIPDAVRPSDLSDIFSRGRSCSTRVGQVLPHDGTACHYFAHDPGIGIIRDVQGGVAVDIADLCRLTVDVDLRGVLHDDGHLGAVGPFQD